MATNIARGAQGNSPKPLPNLSPSLQAHLEGQPKIVHVVIDSCAIDSLRSVDSAPKAWGTPATESPNQSGKSPEVSRMVSARHHQAAKGERVK